LTNAVDTHVTATLLTIDNYLVGGVFVSILVLFACLDSWIRRFSHRRDLVKVLNLGYAHIGIVLSEKNL
jgi:hypothetical protein